jgi:hypothetical protein
MGGGSSSHEDDDNDGRWSCTVQGLRILDHCCDLQIDDPITPLALWEGVEGEVAGGWLQAFMVTHL